MITLDQALKANEFWHMTEKNADGTPARCRRTGKTQTWKSKPGLFRIPVKHGLRTSFFIQNFGDYDEGAPAGKGNQHRNENLFCIPERWEVEHQLFAGVKP